MPAITGGWWTSSSVQWSRNGPEDMGQVERNVLGVALRQEMETRLVPELLAVHALLLEANSETLGRIPEWLDRVSTALPADAEFLKEMGRLLDPVGYQVLEENSGLLSVESETSRAFTGYLWEMAPRLPVRPSVT